MSLHPGGRSDPLLPVRDVHIYNLQHLLNVIKHPVVVKLLLMTDSVSFLMNVLPNVAFFLTAGRNV